MAIFGKRNNQFKIELTNSDQATAHGGQILIDHLCREFGLYKKIAQTPILDPRIRKTVGFKPEAIIAQFIHNFTSGGSSLSDAGRLGQDSVLMGLLGMEKGADESTLGEWLRAQTKESILALHELNRDWVRWALEKATPGRILHAGQLELFFDDTEIEVFGKKIEGARINYDGKLALSWQTLWVGPFLLDGILDGAGDVSQHLPVLLREHASFWQGRPSYFYADSGSSAGKYLNEIAQAGFSRWSVSYNKWTSVLDKLAQQLPESQWSEARENNSVVEQHAWIKHMPGENEEARLFAAVRRKAKDELLWRYHYTVCEAAQNHTPQAVFERHALKGAKEQGFSQVLNDLDLHHPPCLELLANQAFYAIGMLAFNILTAFKILKLGDAEQGWQVRTIIRQMLTLPVKVSRHARTSTATICIPAGWLRWWRIFVDHCLPKRKPGRPTQEELTSGTS